MFMKQKITLVFTFILFTAVSFAQTGNSAKKPSLVGIHFSAVDFTTIPNFKNKTQPKDIANFKDLDFGLSLSYWTGLTSNIDFSLKASGFLHSYGFDRNPLRVEKKELGIELEPTLNFQLFKDGATFSPFLTTGVGVGYYTGEFGAYLPAGVGLQANFNSETYIFLQAQYRFTLTKDDLKDHLFYSLGVAQSIGSPKPRVAATPAPPVVLDRDNDGVPDETDKCPDTPGLASLMGCPDKDGDGIADGDDKCPDVAGIAKYQGCPIPDTDGDGINDEEDKCPTVKGIARYQGCPIPDTDNDGVNDEMDKCPTRPGPASNQGCPEIAKEIIEKVSMAAKNVFYSTGSYKLLSKSFKSLNEVAEILKADESLMLDIDGHTDAVGSDESNHTLSHNRANSVKEYLVSKGIDESRLKTTGYGEEKPIADNDTAAGRAKNRRTEMTVRNF
jgi:OmpA-OmpF porin, OOP family